MLARFDIVLVAFPFTDGPNVKLHDHAGETACASEDRHAARGSAASLCAHPAGACGCGGTLSGLAFGPRPPDPLRQRRGAPLPAGSRLPDQGSAQLAGAARQLGGSCRGLVLPARRWPGGLALTRGGGRRSSGPAVWGWCRWGWGCWGRGEERQYQFRVEARGEN